VTNVELSFSLTKPEAREGLIVRDRVRSGLRSSLWVRLGKQLLLGLLLSFLGVLCSQLFGQTDPIPGMFGVLLGAVTILIIWQVRWMKAISSAAEELADFSTTHGPTTAVFNASGVELVSSIGRAKLPWFAIAQVLTAKNVTVLRYGAQSIVVPHRCLPTGLEALEFDRQLEAWRAST